MKSLNSVPTLLAMAAVALSGGAFTVASANQGNYVTPGANMIQSGKQTPMRGITMQQEQQAMRGLFSGCVRATKYPRPGYSVKQGQRMASKSRNQASNRRAHR